MKDDFGHSTATIQINLQPCDYSIYKPNAAVMYYYMAWHNLSSQKPRHPNLHQYILHTVPEVSPQNCEGYRT